MRTCFVLFVFEIELFTFFLAMGSANVRAVAPVAKNINELEDGHLLFLIRPGHSLRIGRDPPLR